MFYEKFKAPLEAMLFISGDPLTYDQIADILQIDKESIDALITELQEDMNKSGRGLMIKKIADSYQMCTKPEMSSYLEKLTEITDKKLSVPAMETLSIIAFKQPITKQEIENIRGVRIDYIIGAEEMIHLLEVNTTPGMTATSFIPQQVRAAGLEIRDVMTEIIENEIS